MLKLMWSPWWDVDEAKFVTPLALLFTLFWYLLIWKKSRKSTTPLPPGPRGLPLLGYLPFLGTDLHHDLTNLAKTYGPLYKLKLGTKLYFVISSPTLVKQVLHDHETIFSNRDATVAAQIASYGGTDIAFAPYGPDWRKLRKVVMNHTLSNANVDACYALRKEEVDRSISHIYGKVGTPIDFGDVAFFTSINTLKSLVWSGTQQEEKGATDVGVEWRKVVKEIIGLLVKPNVSDFFPMLARFDIQGIRRRQQKAISVTDKIISSAIEIQMSMPPSKNEGLQKKKKGRKDLLEFLLELHNKDSATLTMQEIKALLMDLLTGGSDTTTTMMEWVMTELMQNPEEMRKVQEELTEIVGLNNLVEEFHLPKLHYLDAVIKETFRLHPALPLLVPHRVTPSTTLGGYTIPKGSSVFLNIWANHRDSSVWESPLEFRPQRFINDPSKFNYKGSRPEFLPFGSGRRRCVGMPLGERMLIHVLASFLHLFEWRLPHGAKPDFLESFGVVTRKLNQLVVIPTPRLSTLELYP
ncbi:PREDICTED: flavonoid [Prunus dulcis]|uniref:PREDICTED: flavonoid n=1 Tax=Prunus dulcis TaxID=3755 RepID=A0A5E4GIR6_PRUDU|nr:labd-13Z-ene-9,15,16-triol synthase, chloroplastic-like [Prunus dulcis]VVA39462.1 PREDICTED: flavonoid [Prunus dulcis]